MNRSNTQNFLNRFWIREAAIWLAAFFVFSFILLNRSPNLLRPLSMNMRFGFTWLVPLLFIVLYFSFRLYGWLGKFLSLTFALCLFALALAGVWASGHTQSTYISGLIPLYDAQTYYVDALRLLSGKSMLEFSAARPLFAGLLATLLSITGRDLTLTLIILTGVSSLSCYFATQALRATHGVIPAVFLLIFLFIYYRYRTVGAVMSEHIGLTLGVLAITFLWHGIKTNDSKLAVYGLFIYSLALNARPGPFFILPALLLWGSWYYRHPDRRFSGRFFLLGIFAVGAAFGASLLIKQLFGISSGVPFSQFSYALYGLASGGNSWAHIFQVHPELENMANPELTYTAYKLTFDLIRQHPSLFVQGIFHNWSVFFSNSWYGVFSYVGGENFYLNVAARGFLYLLCLFGIIKWAQKPGESYTSFIMAATMGLLASVPFVPPADAYGMRLYAASIAIVGLLPAMGLVFLCEKLKIEDQAIHDTGSLKGAIGLSALLSSILLVGPFFAFGTNHLPQTKAYPCEQGTNPILVNIDSGTSISVVREKDPGLDWMPIFHYGLFKRNAHSLPDGHFVRWLEKVGPRNTLFYTLDHNSNQAVLVVMPTSLFPPAGSVAEICGQWEDDVALKAYSIFAAKSVTVLPETK